GGQGSFQPLFLRRAKQAALRIVPVPTGGGVHFARAEPAARRACLAVAVLAVVEQIERREPANALLRIDAHFGTGSQARHGAGQHRRAQRHVFVERLVGGGAPRGEAFQGVGRRCSSAITRGKSCVIVLHFVVVPGVQ